MITYFVMGLRGFFILAAKIWSFICYIFRRQIRSIIQNQTVKYEIIPLSPLSKHRLSMLKRKTLVLDLDETLIHSHHDGVLRQTVKPGTPPDFVLKHCSFDFGSYTKDLAAISSDLSSIFILDNSPVAYKSYPDNAIPIDSWFCDARDTALLCLLPMLDALRFTNDVRSVLSRNLHLQRP
ncbi:Hypothetical predicted protein [Octopus vulgaris]|uniref:Mitochondrial import inner membrane translocase subunit TIM50 n=1 Tax=Octopus vulgaris TaxID=6645 RepID=A0AA36BWZ3_OCTVU|nr:Hypothetical predicted protein [Octopus vulgaris]